MELHKQELISSSDLESARNNFLAAEATQLSAKRQYENATITTPISGIVTARPVNFGAMINPGLLRDGLPVSVTAVTNLYLFGRSRNCQSKRLSTKIRYLR